MEEEEERDEIVGLLIRFSLSARAVKFFPPSPPLAQPSDAPRGDHPFPLPLPRHPFFPPPPFLLILPAYLSTRYFLLLARPPPLDDDVSEVGRATTLVGPFYVLPLPLPPPGTRARPFRRRAKGIARDPIDFESRVARLRASSRAMNGGHAAATEQRSDRHGQP